MVFFFLKDVGLLLKYLVFVLRDFWCIAEVAPRLSFGRILPRRRSTLRE